MNSHRKIEERIKKKRAEIQELELKIREAKAYIQAMNDAAKLIPYDGDDGPNQTDLREGSMMATARDAIRQAGKPLHISKLLEAVGKPVNRKSRASLAGSISSYVRRGEIFTRPRPNTFGLVELEATGAENMAPPAPPPTDPLPAPTDKNLSLPPAPPPSPKPPVDFGIDDEEDQTPF